MLKALRSRMILENGTMDAEIHIEEAFPLAVKNGKKILGKRWNYQLSTRWCQGPRASIDPKLEYT